MAVLSWDNITNEEGSPWKKGDDFSSDQLNLTWQERKSIRKVTDVRQKCYRKRNRKVLRAQRRHVVHCGKTWGRRLQAIQKAPYELALKLNGRDDEYSSIVWLAMHWIEYKNERVGYPWSEWKRRWTPSSRPTTTTKSNYMKRTIINGFIPNEYRREPIHRAGEAKTFWRLW